MTEVSRFLAVTIRVCLSHPMDGVSRRKPRARLINQTVTFVHDPCCRRVGTHRISRSEASKVLRCTTRASTRGYRRPTVIINLERRAFGHSWKSFSPAERPTRHPRHAVSPSQLHISIVTD
ncbi:hypothetical protein EXIGLDRAFT_337353 [Exidia glandulosa HHB12029]|uniref:Uncharacterized protein n=1 Tax=Exidia glandulosa HHB12029 TaxID=1314781 RepID=A0A165LIQ9_EXIGL|nr:hypothetical protein EXIGLDRAFT_337353 [Exidia glandulosa HHB12029]